MLLLSINRKPYIGSQIAPSHLTVSDREGQCQGLTYGNETSHRLYCHKTLIHVVNRIWAVLSQTYLTLSDFERSKSRSHRFPRPYCIGFESNIANWSILLYFFLLIYFIVLLFSKTCKASSSVSSNAIWMTVTLLILCILYNFVTSSH